MADSDKNIIITPNRGATGSTGQPQIRFVGQNADPITLRVLDITGSSAGAISFEGSAGQLFSITNSLTSGSLFSVNDISGLPSIDVNANGTILFAGFTGNVGIGATAGISGSAYRLTVIGNEYVTASLMVGGGASITGGFSVTGGLTAFGSVTIRNGLDDDSGGLSVTGGAGITGGMTLWGPFVANDGISSAGATFGGAVNMTTNIIRDLEMRDYYESLATPTFSSGVLTCDLNASQVFNHTLSASITRIVLQNVPSKASTSIGFTLVLKQAPAGGFTAAFTGISGATALFPGGTAPTMSSAANKTDIVSYISYDNGSNWFGFVGGQAF